MSKKKLRKANKKLKKKFKYLESIIESTDNDLQETKRFNVEQFKRLQEQFKELESYVVKEEKGITVTEYIDCCGQVFSDDDSIDITHKEQGCGNIKACKAYSESDIINFTYEVINNSLTGRSIKEKLDNWLENK